MEPDEHLTDWEAQFVRDVLDGGEATVAQLEKLKQIHEERAVQRKERGDE